MPEKIILEISAGEAARFCRYAFRPSRPLAVAAFSSLTRP